MIFLLDFSYCMEEDLQLKYNLIGKILNNIHVTFENIIVKFVEEDISLSLTINNGNYCTTDDNWMGAFIGKEGRKDISVGPPL